jgi:hypothetical protein
MFLSFFITNYYKFTILSQHSFRSSELLFLNTFIKIYELKSKKIYGIENKQKYKRFENNLLKREVAWFVFLTVQPI